MFVHRDEYYETNEEDKARVAGEADIIVAKQRNGPTGDVKLVWKGEFTRFENLAHKAHDEFAPIRVTRECGGRRLPSRAASTPGGHCDCRWRFRRRFVHGDRNPGHQCPVPFNSLSR